MGKAMKNLLKLAVAAAGVYAVGKYIHDYTDYKLAEKKDLDELKNGGEHAREAAKRTYIALKTGDDINQPAGELGTAVAQIAGGAGKIMNTVSANTKEFALNEKEKYREDPAAYRAKVAENLKDMGQQATGIFDGLKTDAENIINDIKETAEGFRNEPDDFVDGTTEKADKPVTVDGGFMEVSEEPLYTEEPEKHYADITPVEVKEENKPESDQPEALKEKAKEKSVKVQEKIQAKAGEMADKKGIEVSEDPEEIKQ